VKIQVDVILVVRPCNDVRGYQSFGGPCCLHLQSEVLSHCPMEFLDQLSIFFLLRMGLRGGVTRNKGDAAKRLLKGNRNI